MHDTPEQIAARMTKAQRRAILWLPKDGKQRCWCLRDQTDFRPGIEGISFELRKIARGSFDATWWRLTPLGAAVRAVVAKEDGDAT